MKLPRPPLNTRSGLYTSTYFLQKPKLFLKTSAHFALHVGGKSPKNNVNMVFQGFERTFYELRVEFLNIGHPLASPQTISIDTHWYIPRAKSGGR